MNLKNKLVMAGVGVAASGIAILSGLGSQSALALNNYEGDSAVVAPQSQSGSELGGYNVLELGAISRVLREMQTIPAERISGDSWSLSYTVVGNELQIDQLTSLASGRGGKVTQMPGYAIVGFSEYSDPNDTSVNRVTLEEVANAAYGSGLDKVAGAALGFEINRKASGLNIELCTIYIAPK